MGFGSFMVNLFAALFYNQLKIFRFISGRQPPRDRGGPPHDHRQRPEYVVKIAVRTFLAAYRAP